MSHQLHHAAIREAPTMVGAQVPGRGGLLVVGAIASILHIVWRSVLTAGVDPAVSAQEQLWVPVNVIGAAGGMLVLAGLPAISASMTAAGRIGLALIEGSWTFFGIFLSLYGALVLPWLATEAPGLVSGTSSLPTAFVVAFAAALLAWLLGAVVMAIPLLGGSGPTRWAGIVLPASALWTLLGTLVIAPDGPADDLAVNLVSNLGPVLLLIGLGALGLRAGTERADTYTTAGDKR